MKKEDFLVYDEKEYKDHENEMEFIGKACCLYEHDLEEQEKKYK